MRSSKIETRKRRTRKMGTRKMRFSKIETRKRRTRKMGTRERRAKLMRPGNSGDYQDGDRRMGQPERQRSVRRTSELLVWRPVTEDQRDQDQQSRTTQPWTVKVWVINVWISWAGASKSVKYKEQQMASSG